MYDLYPEICTLYHRADFHGRLIRALIIWHALDATSLNTVSRNSTLQFGISAIALEKYFARDSARLIWDDAASVLLACRIVLHVVGLVVVSIDMLLSVLRHSEEWSQKVFVGKVRVSLDAG